MNLYLISQNENNDYDVYDSAVVCVPDAETARLMDPGGENGGLYEFSGETARTVWCSSPDKVDVKFLGVADSSIPLGVVCASYNAG